MFARLVDAPDHKLGFTKYSKTGWRSARPVAFGRHVTTVALFYANETGLEVLRRKEGVPRHYVEKITVIDAGGAKPSDHLRRCR